MRRFLKWLLVGWMAFWALLFVAVVVAVMLREAVPSHSVLRISLREQLAAESGASLSSLLGEESAPTLRDLCEAVRFAATDARIDGLVMDVDSAELSLAELAELEAAMAVFRQSGKPSVAYLDSAGELGPGDADYAAAVTAGEVVMSPVGSVNLAGPRAVVPFLRGALDKLEVQPYFDKRAAYKTAPNTFTEKAFTPAHEQSIKELVDGLQATLLDHVAARRAVDRGQVLTWMRDGPLTAKAALEGRVVDRLDYWGAVLDAAEERCGRDDCFVELGTYARQQGLHDAGPTLAIIPVEGEIHGGESEPGLADGSVSAGADSLVRAFRKARRDDVRGILVRVDSPGGSYVASDAIRHEIELSRAAKIPVVVSMGTYAASGGYLVALEADAIFAQPGTITGSIGVFGGTFATREFFARLLGVTFGLYEPLPEAFAPSFLDGPDARERAALSRELDRIYAEFKARVAKARDKSEVEIEALAQGRVWSGRDAKTHGLVDELGGMEEALVRLAALAGLEEGGSFELVRYPERKGPLELVAEALGPSTRAPAELRSLWTAVRSAAKTPAERSALSPVQVSLGR